MLQVAVWHLNHAGRNPLPCAVTASRPVSTPADAAQDSAPAAAPPAPPTGAIRPTTTHTSRRSSSTTCKRSAHLSHCRPAPLRPRSFRRCNRYPALPRRCHCWAECCRPASGPAHPAGWAAAVPPAGCLLGCWVGREVGGAAASAVPAAAKGVAEEAAVASWAAGWAAAT